MSQNGVIAMSAGIFVFSFIASSGKWKKSSFERQKSRKSQETTFEETTFLKSGF